jgi:hypothetical protein
MRGADPLSDDATPRSINYTNPICLSRALAGFSAANRRRPNDALERQNHPLGNPSNDMVALPGAFFSASQYQ